MFNSKMYKKYYPIKSSFDIANMNVAEQKKLIYWIKSLSEDIRLHNMLSGEKLLHYVDTVNYVYITEYKKSKLYFVTYYTFDKYAEPDRCIIEERGSTAISIIKFGNVPESGTRR